MRCGTLQFGCSLVRCGSVDRVIYRRVHARDHYNYYGFDIDFEMRAQTANSANFGKFRFSV